MGRARNVNNSMEIETVNLKQDVKKSKKIQKTKKIKGKKVKTNNKETTSFKTKDNKKIVLFKKFIKVFKEKKEKSLTNKTLSKNQKKRLKAKMKILKKKYFLEYLKNPNTETLEMKELDFALEKVVNVKPKIIHFKNTVKKFHNLENAELNKINRITKVEFFKLNPFEAIKRHLKNKQKN